MNNTKYKRASAPFVNRTIQTISDFSIEEQRYLYKKTAQIKQAIIHREYSLLNTLKINNDNFLTYLLFLENSTRTKESFYNAAQFHNIRIKDLSFSNSSLNKNETLTDTVKTLMGYAEHACFIVRTSTEGVCSWFNVALQKHADICGIEMPFCINAGDGNNQHPTQEMLDVFSFLEYYKGDTSCIHIALIGDLLHSRTIHSKCEGLQIFKEVKIDLIAPEEIALPLNYVTEMEKAGFEVRKFESLDEYCLNKEQANLWYFTRLQKERLDQELHPHIQRILSKISCNSIHLESINDESKFFHPLPRDKFNPTIPYSLDSSPFNGWDQQSINGYYVRIALLAMLKGSIGEDFDASNITASKGGKKIHNIDNNFIIEKPITTNPHPKPIQKIGIKPVTNGLVIDHIAKGEKINNIWNRIHTIRHIMNFNVVSSHGVYPSYADSEYKGIISLPDFILTEPTQLKKLGAISPGCSINFVENSRVAKKLQILQPPRIYNFKEINCRNPRCISYKNNLEQAYADFYKYENEYYCSYCETPHYVNEIWNIE